MEQNNLSQDFVQVKKQKNILKIIVVILLILLVGIAMFILGQYVSSQNYHYVKEQENEKIDNTQNENSSNLSTVAKIYEEAYIKMSEIDGTGILKTEFINNNIINTINESEAKKYFTDKAIDYLNKNSNNIQNILLSSIFNVTDQEKRTLTVVLENKDTLIASGQIVNGGSTGQLSNDKYPLYIIFKNINGVWKIDMFD